MLEDTIKYVEKTIENGKNLSPAELNFYFGALNLFNEMEKKQTKNQNTDIPSTI